MLLPTGDGTYSMGPLDAIFIWKHRETGRFHPVFFEEYPMPGPPKKLEEMAVVRLKSKMHHAAGFLLREEAIASIDDFRKSIFVDDECVFLDPIDWDGEVEIMIVPNWRRRAA